MILLELKPNEAFKLIGNDKHIYSVWNPNENGTIRVRKVAIKSKDNRVFMLPELELLNLSKFTEVEII